MLRDRNTVRIFECGELKDTILGKSFIVLLEVAAAVRVVLLLHDD